MRFIMILAFILLSGPASAQALWQEAARLNLAINSSMRYASDQEAWGAEDYWASPKESAQVGRGDCEDFAIAKFFAAKASGLKARLAYGRLGGQGHMVAIVWDGQRWLVLDCTTDAIIPLDGHPTFQALYSFDERDLWTSDGRVFAGKAASLGKWQAVLAKI